MPTNREIRQLIDDIRRGIGRLPEPTPDEVPLTIGQWWAGVAPLIRAGCEFWAGRWRQNTTAYLNAFDDQGESLLEWLMDAQAEGAAVVPLTPEEVDQALAWLAQPDRWRWQQIGRGRGGVMAHSWAIYPADTTPESSVVQDAINRAARLYEAQTGESVLTGDTSRLVEWLHEVRAELGRVSWNEPLLTY
jgi:hypothetical protein